MRRAAGVLAILLLVVVAALLAGRRPVAGDADTDGAPATHRHAPKQLWTCGMHPEVIRDEPGLCPICHMQLTPLAVDGAEGSAVTINPVVVQNMGVRTAEASVGVVTRTIRAAGFLAEAEPNVRDVSLRVSGWIDTLHADTVGMHVEAGAPLFTLYSPEIHVAVEELIAARRARAASATDANDPSAVVVRAGRRKLELFGLEAREIDRLERLDQAPRTVTIPSPITGHVTEKLVVAGSAVKAGERVLRIVDHRDLWLDVRVHPQDLPLVRLGQAVRATVDGVPGRVISGTLTFIAPHLDPATRTATVRARIPNPDLALRPDMYAAATIDATGEGEALLVPREAVIDTGRRRLAFVAVGQGTFEPRDVELGATSDDGFVEIVRGISAGELVVTSGQFLLDAESRMREAIQKHLADRLLREQP